VRKFISFLELSIERLFTRLGFGMRAKLILIFVVIKVIPLVLLTLMAWRQASRLGEELAIGTHELTVKAGGALSEMGKISVHDSVSALNASAIDNIERMSTDIARAVANFLYARDDDIRYLAGIPPEETAYRHFAESRRGRILKSGVWILSPDKKSWIPGEAPRRGELVASSNPENESNYHNRAADVFEYENRPLYREITFVDPEGNERIKITTSPLMDRRLKNVADRRNTFVRAETYFAELKKLAPGEIYVSDVIGAYVRSHLIGMYNPENTASRGLEFVPEKEAYAGRENPRGKRFEGIIRWATPVLQDGRLLGYVTGPAHINYPPEAKGD
jgi:hypothetical protein